LDLNEARDDGLMGFWDDSGISWTICKSAPRSRQITTPATHHSVFTGRMPFMSPNQQRQSTEGNKCHFMTKKICDMCTSLKYAKMDSSTTAVLTSEGRIAAAIY